MSLAHGCTFISANHIIFNIGYLKQTGKKNCNYLDNKYIFTFFLKKCKKIEFHEKRHEKYIQSMGHAYAYCFSKTYIVWYRIKQKNKKHFTVLFPRKTMFKFKNIPQKDCPNTAPAASTAGPCPVIYFPVVPGLP